MGHPIIHIILGEEPLPDNRPSPGHQARLNAMASVVKRGDYVICSGGVTVPGALSEAAVGLKYLQNSVKLPEDIILDKEEAAQTTVQNFSFCAEKLRGMQRYPVIIYGGRSQFVKALVFRSYYMRDREVSFRACHDYRGWPYILLQNIAGGLLAYLDPKETWIAKGGWGKKLRWLLDHLPRLHKQ